MLSLFQVPLVQALGWALLHFLWQGALLALLCKGVLGLIPQRAPNLRYAVALGALAAMVVAVVATGWSAYRALQPEPTRFAPVSIEAAAPPGAARLVPETTAERGRLQPVPVVSVPTRLQEVPLAAAPDGSAFASALRGAQAWLKGRIHWVVLAWLFGVMAFSLRLTGGMWTVRRLRRTRAPLPPAWQETLARLSRALGMRRAVAAFESPAVWVPTVVGWLRPAILIPTSALAGLAPDQLEAVLAHELAHIRRHDLWVNLVQSALEVLLFYHPAVWWVSAQARREREHCCDDHAVRACGDVRTYVRALAQLETLRGRGGPRLAAALDGHGSLLKRVRRLALGAPATAARPRWLGGALALTALALFVLQPQLSVAFDPHGKVYWAERDGGALRRANLDGTGLQTVLRDLDHPLGVALAPSLGKVYWSDEAGRLRRANLDGTGVETLWSTPGPIFALALDVGGGKVYWAEPTQIRRAGLDGSGVETVVSGLQGPSSLRLEPRSGALYWTALAGRLQRADLDGSHVETLITGLKGPSGLALDPAGGALYWSEAQGGRIRRAALDGSGARTLFTGMSAPAGLELDSARQTLYWADAASGRLYSATLNGFRVRALGEGLRNPVGVVLALE